MKVYSIRSAIVAAFALAALASHASAAVVRLPECKVAGQQVTANLSTNVPGIWTVTGPGASGPTATTLGPWTAVSGYWVQPKTPASSPASGSSAAGDYTYTVQVYVPCEPRNYASIAIGGSIAADNSFKAYLNGSTTPFAACAGPTSFNTPATGTAFSLTGSLVRGINTITVVVHNNEPYTGLAPLIVEQIMTLVDRVAREESASVLLVEQNIPYVMKTVDDVYVLKNGGVVGHGAPSEFSDIDSLMALF